MNELPKPELMFDFSHNTLRDLQMASLDRAARHLKSAKLAWNEAVREEAIGVLALYFLQHREEMLEAARRTIEVKATLTFPESIRKLA